MTQNADTSQEKSAREPRIAKVKGRAVCPKGHRAPRVQYLASEELYCCTTCAITWKAIFEVTIPAEMSAEKWAQMAMAAPDTLAALKAMTRLMQIAADEIDTDARHPMRGYGGKTVRENIYAANQAIAKAEKP